MDEIRKRFNQVQDMGVSVKAMLMEMIGTGLFVLIGLLVAVYSVQEAPLSGALRPHVHSSLPSQSTPHFFSYRSMCVFCCVYALEWLFTLLDTNIRGCAGSATIVATSPCFTRGERSSPCNILTHKPSCCDCDADAHRCCAQSSYRFR